jgi:hypothetical protein
MMVIKIIRGTLLGVFLSIVYTSCASDAFKFKPNHTTVNKELDKYRAKIYKMSKGKLGTKNISLGFIKTPKDKQELLGVCTFILPKFQNEIDITVPSWYYLSDRRKLLLVAHEYRHCECDHYYHTDEKLEDGCPQSIMHTYLIEDKCVNRHFGRYVDEIRRGCGS